MFVDVVVCLVVCVVRGVLVRGVVAATELVGVGLHACRFTYDAESSRYTCKRMSYNGFGFVFVVVVRTVVGTMSILC